MGISNPGRGLVRGRGGWASTVASKAVHNRRGGGALEEVQCYYLIQKKMFGDTSAILLVMNIETNNQCMVLLNKISEMNPLFERNVPKRGLSGRI